MLLDFVSFWIPIKSKKALKGTYIIRITQNGARSAKDGICPGRAFARPILDIRVEEVDIVGCGENDIQRVFVLLLGRSLTV